MHTFGDLVFSTVVRRQTRVRDGLLILTGSMLLAACAKVQVPGPVPFTMQTFAVVFLGAMLGGRRGGLCMILYLLEGMVGLPVFAGAVAGPAYFAGPTGGYLFGFVPAAFLVGRLAERGWDRRFLAALAAMVLGSVVILAAGFAWLAVLSGPRVALAVGVVPFLPGAVLKALLAAAVLPAGWKCVRFAERAD
ncbi:MAG: biotin transporter BioY [Phycisphaerae bacterium]